MLRTGASRAAFRSLQRANLPAVRPVLNCNTNKAQWSSKLCTLASRRPQLSANTVLTPITSTLVRRRLTGNPYDKIDKKAEEKIAQQKLKATPETVSATSSIHPVMGEVGVRDEVEDVDMLAGLRSDVETIKDTFSLNEVPRQAYVIGLAGVLPYLATSLATVFCAYEVNHAATATNFLLSEKSAELLLGILEPLQVGYGAVILSFLGAIHWGLEWAGYGGYQGYRRYAIGVIAPAIAWPTILFPATYALITQFLGFVWLYYVDARATVRGWTPPWYGTYRFVLTFIVGASLVLSLIGRGEVFGRVKKLPSPTDRLLAYRENAARELALMEEAKAQAIEAKEEEERAREEEERAKEEEAAGAKEEGATEGETSDK